MIDSLGASSYSGVIQTKRKGPHVRFHYHIHQHCVVWVEEVIETLGCGCMKIEMIQVELGV